jgi:anti-sigma factor RsiW
MKCDEVHERLATYLDDEVTAEEGRALRAHLENCPACWAEMAALWAVQSRVKRALGADAARVEAPADAWDRLRARLAFEPSPTVDAPARYESERTPHAAQRPVRQSLVVKVLSLAAMVVMMALFVGLILVPEMNRRSQPSAPGGNTPTGAAAWVGWRNRHNR